MSEEKKTGFKHYRAVLSDYTTGREEDDVVGIVEIDGEKNRPQDHWIRDPDGHLRSDYRYKDLDAGQHDIIKSFELHPQLKVYYLGWWTRYKDLDDIGQICFFVGAAILAFIGFALGGYLAVTQPIPLAESWWYQIVYWLVTGVTAGGIVLAMVVASINSFFTGRTKRDNHIYEWRKWLKDSEETEASQANSDRWLREHLAANKKKAEDDD